MTSATPTSPSSAATGLRLDALTEDGLTAASARRGEPDWLRDRRLEAFKRYLDQTWPDSRRDEYWRSTPFERRVDVARPVSGTTRIDVVVPEGADERVVVTDLATAAGGAHAELVRRHLGSLTTTATDGTGTDEDRTITASDAAWTTGVLVHVPAEVELAEPIVVRIHVDEAGAHLPRVLIVLDHHASARVHLEHTSALPGGETALVDEVVEGVVGEAASLDLASLQEWDDAITHLSLQKVAAHRGATYRHLAVAIGGATVRLRPEVDLVGEGASCFPLGVYFADDQQWFDLQPYIRHLVPRATSDVLYKGALQGRSRTVFRGNVLVAENAAGTDTNETNRSLILNDGARADSTPFLEIFCADVTAGHGSATGQIDARQLYYLQARGIPREQALRLIVHGFFREVLDRVRAPALEQRVLDHIERELASADLASIGVSEAALTEVDHP